jgi:hypothetical protein
MTDCSHDSEAELKESPSRGRAKFPQEVRRSRRKPEYENFRTRFKRFCETHRFIVHARFSFGSVCTQQWRRLLRLRATIRFGFAMAENCADVQTNHLRVRRLSARRSVSDGQTMATLRIYCVSSLPRLKDCRGEGLWCRALVQRAASSAWSHR